ncbi:molybdopterin-dependent oxidoreductase [Halobellus rufus]|uniref:molybdopterin-dependent oxidoreductase n=1 Tax=Halobellus rufus TaxID=1448860 RepID=UPI000679802C|nr:molybdopterin-dependent oxidoreductase [Halobellus rufus]
MTELERHEVPEDVPTEIEPVEWSLDVTGRVREPVSLSRGDLASLPSETFVGDFACAEGWVADDCSWRGVRVESVLDRAGVDDGVAYGLVHAADGDYACALPLDRLSSAVLAFELDGAALDRAHGGPARLVPTDEGRDCWESVKWVAEIELRRRQPTDADTARERALSRIE